MPAPPTLGLLLSREDERATMRRAAMEVGLAAVDMLPSVEQADAGPSEMETRALVAHKEPLPSVQSFPLIVTDKAWLTAHKAGPGGESFAIVLQVREADSPDELQTGSDSWILHRPLHPALVRVQLQHAAYVCKTFAARHHAMVEELHRCRRIFDSVCNGITITDPHAPDAALVYVNPAFERMTGYTAREVLGRNCRFLQRQDNDQPALAEIRTAIREQREVRVLLKNYRKDGNPFWNELSLSPILDLEGRLTYYVGIQNDVTQQVESARRLDHLASHDYLTGLANRSLLMEQLSQAVERSRRNGAHMAVLFFDLDNFKQVNDELGHDAGDRLLQIVAARLRAETRAGEVVARMGGDEFVVLLEGFSDDRRPRGVMRRLTTKVSEKLELCGQQIHPSASGGMAIFPKDGDTPEALLKAADEHMYAAKHSARQRQLSPR